MTFQLKPTGAVFDYVKQMEDLNLLIEEEEERIRGKLSGRNRLYSRVLTENCQKIGALGSDAGEKRFMQSNTTA